MIKIRAFGFIARYNDNARSLFLYFETLETDGTYEVYIEEKEKAPYRYCSYTHEGSLARCRIVNGSLKRRRNRRIFRLSH